MCSGNEYKSYKRARAERFTVKILISLALYAQFQSQTSSWGITHCIVLRNGTPISDAFVHCELKTVLSCYKFNLDLWYEALSAQSNVAADHLELPSYQCSSESTR